MRLSFKGIKVENNEGKLVINLLHDYRIKDTDVIVSCEYLTSEERGAFASQGNDIVNNILRKKVKAIKNLVIEVETDNDIQEYPITTIDELLQLPDAPVRVIYDEIITHLLASDSITEEEEKNSDSGISA